MDTALFAIFGLLIGGPLNAVIDRLPPPMIMSTASSQGVRVPEK